LFLHAAFDHLWLSQCRHVYEQLVGLVKPFFRFKRLQMVVFPAAREILAIVIARETVQYVSARNFILLDFPL